MFPTYDEIIANGITIVPIFKTIISGIAALFIAGQIVAFLRSLLGIRRDSTKEEKE